MRPDLSEAVLSAWMIRNESTEFGSAGPGSRTGRSAAPAPCRRAPAPATEKPTIIAPPPLTNDLRENSLFEHLGHGYFPPFAITAAAFWIAVRIRGYVPQRHRWPFIAVRICASVGRFVVASRSAAWIIIPFWQ